MKNKTKGKLMLLGLPTAVVLALYIFTDLKAVVILTAFWITAYLLYLYVKRAVELMDEEDSEW